MYAQQYCLQLQNRMQIIIFLYMPPQPKAADASVVGKVNSFTKSCNTTVENSPNESCTPILIKLRKTCISGKMYCVLSKEFIDPGLSYCVL